MTYQPQSGDVAVTAVSSNGQATITLGYLTAALEFMPTAPTLLAGQNSAGNPTVVSTDNSGNVNVNVVSGGGGTSGNGTVALAAGSAVSQAPLPASGVTAVTGTLSSTGATSPIFTPQAGRPFNVSGYATGATALNSSLGGTLYLQKSVDGGVTFLPTTAGGTPFPTFSNVFSEPMLETVVGTQYQMVCSSYSGSEPINVRFAQ